MAKIIEIKNGDTKTLTIKKDSVIKFTDIKEEVLKQSGNGIGSPFDFIRNGKNLIIKNESANINITVKNFFTTKNHGAYTKSKLSGLLFQDSTEVINMGKNYIQNNADYKQFEFDSKNNSAYATMFWDSIDLTGSNYSQLATLKAYTGKGNDKVIFGASTTTTTRTVYAGSDTTTTIDLSYLGKGTTIKEFSATKDSSLKFKGKDNETYIISKYLKNGQNTKIKAYAGNDLKDITLAEYINSYGTKNTKGINLFGDSKSKKKQKIAGNFLNNTLEGGAKADKIYCIDGNNTVTGRGGNDMIYAGLGADTFKFTAYDYGKDKIYNATSADTIYVTDENNIKPDLSSPFQYVKSGNNLVIQSEVWNDKKRKYVASDSITLVNYFKADKGKSINEKDRLVNIKGSDSKITKLTDIEIKVNAAKGTQNLGKGTFDVYYTKGNTTLVADSSSKIYLNQKDGQVLTYDQQKKGNDLVLTCVDVKYNIRKHREVISKKGTITIKDYFKSNSDGSSKINISGAQYVIYNGEMYDFYSPYKSSSDMGTYIHTTSATKTADGYNIFEGLNGKYNNWITGTKKNDKITTKNTSINLFDMRAGNDIVDASNGNAENAFYYSAGLDNYIGGSGRDIYRIGATVTEADSEYDNVSSKAVGFSKTSKLHIKDNGGSNDFMSINTKEDNLRLLFNVTKDNKIGISQTFGLSKNSDQKWDSIMIFDKSALTAKNIQNKNFTGVVEIDDWFKNTNGDKGNGYIETVGIAGVGGSFNKINIDNWVTSVKEDVVKWLNDNNKGSVAEVLNGTDKNAINSLVNVFAGKTYQ